MPKPVHKKKDIGKKHIAMALLLVGSLLLVGAIIIAWWRLPHVDNAGVIPAYDDGVIFSADDETDNTEFCDSPDFVFYNNGFALSAFPGFHDEEFDLTVAIPSIPDAIIYFTIDGNDPMPGADRYVVRGNSRVYVSGRLPETGEIRVEDRTGYWRNAILAYYSDQWLSRYSIYPAEDAEILQGTAFRFRGFIDGLPVTDIITATYIIAADADIRFAGRPVVAVTAPYDCFFYIYSHADRWDTTTRRRLFHYEYFELGDYGYTRVFDLPGSTSLGGSGSRAFAQRTLNVHVARGELDGVIMHPIFTGLYELYRFRLWNGGSTFHWDYMRDPFAQYASSNLGIPFSDNNLAIKFINGEYWGFTTMREHTSNSFFVNARTGLAMQNIAILDKNNSVYRTQDGQSIIFMDVQEGPEEVVLAFYDELIRFATTYDLSTDYARERLFNEFFCQDNFMNYLIVQTFFHNTDWPHNNIRLFRAITPDLYSGNPNEDGRWRFILHDLDWAPAPHPSDNSKHSRFAYLYAPHPRIEDGRTSKFGYVFLVLNNPVFVEQFVEHALYILDSCFQTDRLLSLHEEFVARYTPLLPEMYNRFAVKGSVEASIDNFIYCANHLRAFLTNRNYYYRRILAQLLERVS